MSWIVQNGDWVSLYFVGGGLLLHFKNFSIVIRDFFSVDILMIITPLTGRPSGYLTTQFVDGVA